MNELETKVIKVSRYQIYALYAFENIRKGVNLARPLLDCIFYDGEKKNIVATNGSIVLIYNVREGDILGFDKLFNGLEEKGYKIEILNKRTIMITESIGDYVQYEKAIPKDISKYESYIMDKTYLTYRDMYIMENIVLNTGLIFNPRFFTMIKPLASEFYRCYYCKKNGTPIVLESFKKEIMAIIMPLEK